LNIKNQQEGAMKKLTIVLIFILSIMPMSDINADKSDENNLHDMHLMMQFLDHGLCSALEGANMQMLGQMGKSKNLDRDAIVHGTIMVKDGRAMIKEMLEGKAMRELYQKGDYDKKTMDDLHELGERMLRVIDQIEKIHKSVMK
jgi:hypothetical protein